MFAQRHMSDPFSADAVDVDSTESPGSVLSDVAQFLCGAKEGERGNSLNDHV